jgi:endonuclease/exonuclease/phosphatase family metal-dependent hydrolase
VLSPGELQPPRFPLLAPVLRLGRRLRRWFSRREWGLRLLGLSPSAGTTNLPGLVLIQLDGLGRTQLEQALRAGHMPFLRRLLRREHYRLHTCYSGLPSTTPAVQGELFFGVRSKVPAFSFRDHRTGEVVEMMEPAAAGRIQKELEAAAPGLLEGGSAYSNIYSGGAAECHFCAVNLGWEELLTVPPSRKFLLLLLHSWSIVRVLALLVVEFFLAVADTLRGLIAGQELWHELKFVPRRVAVSGFLREFITVATEIDLTRGLPVVQLNYLGYDEQAHHRGPGSRYAHWTLQGIDEAIARVWNAAHDSPRRDYQVWIYGDHGQEATKPYSKVTGRTVQEAVSEVFSNTPATPPVVRHKDQTRHRSSWLWRRRSLPQPAAPSGVDSTAELQVVAVGPFGFIYCPRPVPPERREELAERLVRQARIPLVLTVDRDGGVGAWNEAGRFRLPEQAADVLGPDHPFLAEAAGDLAALCRHPDAGDFLISGLRPGGDCITFVTEVGSHGGPGPEETRAFALLPGDVPVAVGDRGYLRPTSLREAALGVLGRATPATVRRRAASRRTIRVLTYNVHGCVGRDGKLSPTRIARVIDRADADVVALQELDAGRARSGGVLQAREVARLLDMDFHFHAVWQIEGGSYGNAVLSRRPLRLVRAGSLPGPFGRFARETRGVLWMAVRMDDGQELNVFNTHLGLSPRERREQARALLGSDWLGHPECGEAAVLCGDLNCGPGSAAYGLLLSRLRDAQLAFKGRRPQRTWFSGYPVARPDHVLVGKHVRVVSASVLHSRLAGTASDHLPLAVDLELPT